MAVQCPIRRGTPEDIPEIRAILRAHDEDSEITRVDIVGPYLRHLVEHASVLVAMHEGTVAGYAAAVDAGVALHLADLFIRPDLLGLGIGQRLLAAVLGDARRRTTFASADPRALPLYVRAGMTPLWTLFALEGSPDRLPAPPAELRIEPARPARLAALEHEWIGADRPADHEFWASQADADAFVVLDGSEPVAFAYARARQVSDVRAVDRLLVRPAADPVAVTLAAMRHAARGDAVMTYVAGPSPVLPALLEARFRIVERDQFLASDPGLVDPGRLIPNSGML